MSDQRSGTNTIRANQSKQQGAKASPYDAGNHNSDTGRLELIQADAEDIRLLVASVLAAGDAIMFSCARKGAAYAVTIYHDGVPSKQWAAELEVFEQIVEFFTKVALEQIPPEVQKKLLRLD